MSELLQLIVIVSAWCWSVYNAFQEGQIFGRAGDWLRDKVPAYWLKPVIGCPVCLPSIHGTGLYIAFSDGHYDPLTWIVTIVCASGINFIIKEQLYGENE
jgi:hypothetical protein